MTSEEMLIIISKIKDNLDDCERMYLTESETLTRITELVRTVDTTSVE